MLTRPTRILHEPRLTALAFAAATVFAAPAAFAAPGDPLGPPFAINPPGTLASNAIVARDGLGNFVAAWNGPGGSSLFARRFAADGTPLAAPVQVTDFGVAQRIAIDRSGDYVIAWSGGAIHAQAFAVDGTPRSAPLLVSRDFGRVAVAIDDDGDFIVSWRTTNENSLFIPIIGYLGVGLSFGKTQIHARRFAADGTAKAAEALVDTSLLPLNGATVGSGPGIAADADGNYTIVWEEWPGLGRTAIFGRRYASTGRARGLKFRVDPADGAPSRGPLIAMAANGSATVAWASDHPTGTNSFSGIDIYARHYDASGKAVAAASKINSDTGLFSLNLAMNAAGRAAVVWDGSPSNFCCQPRQNTVQLFNPDGSALGPNHSVATSGSSAAPAVGLDDDGDYLVINNDYNVAQATGQLFSGN